MADRVKVTIHSTYTEWVDPDDYDDPSLDAIRRSEEATAIDTLESVTCYPGELVVTGVEVTEEKQT